ncbi:MAG: hypothetical protein NTZ84_02950 [Candidatus Nealsonbacteria bacterium]|nr:hypothetical protein [Candidatus Nealsonbacteria bacterium]
MDITKKANNKLEVVKNIKNIVDSVLVRMKQFDSSSKISTFHFNTYLIDENVAYDNYEEFLKYFNYDDLTKFEWGSISLSIYKEENNSYKTEKRILSIHVNIVGSGDEFSITVSAQDENIIKEIFDIIFQKILTGCKIYKYNEIEERKNKREEKRKEELRERSDIVFNCIYILENLNTYQERMHQPLKDEKALQEFLFPILKSHFENLLDEFSLQKFASIQYKPDFGIPEGKLLIECKYIRTKSDLRKIQKEISEDIIGYLRAASNQYNKLVILIYNSVNIPISKKFRDDFERIKGVEKIIIAPGVAP